MRGNIINLELYLSQAIEQFGANEVVKKLVQLINADQLRQIENTIKEIEGDNGNGLPDRHE